MKPVPRFPPVFALLIAAVAFTACSDESPTEADSVLDTEAAALLALDTQDGSRDFENTRDCPAGGTIVLTGSIDRTTDDSGVVTFTHTATRELRDCARARADRSVTLDGSMSTSSVRHFLDRAPVGIWTIDRVGSVTATLGDGTVRACETDLTVTIDTEAGTRSVEGIRCGEEIDETGEWNPRDADRAHAGEFAGGPLGGGPFGEGPLFGPPRGPFGGGSSGPGGPPR